MGQLAKWPTRESLMQENVLLLQDSLSSRGGTYLF